LTHQSIATARENEIRSYEEAEAKELELRKL
jgi:hypothetical protein